MSLSRLHELSFFFSDTAPPEINTLSLHDALPISAVAAVLTWTIWGSTQRGTWVGALRSEEHTSELQSLRHLVCRLLLEKKKVTSITRTKDKTNQLFSLMLPVIACMASCHSKTAMT